MLNKAFIVLLDMILIKVMIENFLNIYYDYIEGLNSIENIEEFSSIMYSENSLDNIFKAYCEILVEVHWSIMITIFSLGSCAFFLALTTFYYKYKHENSRPNKCQICQDRISRIILIPCGHLCICRPCLNDWLIELKRDYRRFHCIICRCKVEKWHHSYFT